MKFFAGFNAGMPALFRCSRAPSLALIVIAAALLGAASARGDGPAIAGLAVGNNADGRLEVFQVDREGELRHRWQRKFTRDWSSWSSLGGAFAPGIAVLNDPADRLCVFALNTASHAVAYTLQKEPNSPAWSNWTALPGPQQYSCVAACKDAGGRFEVFVVGIATHSVQRIRQLEDENQWSGWTDVGGNVQPGLAVAPNGAGLVEVFGIDARGGSLVHCMEDEAQPWMWSSMGESVQPGFAVGQNTDGRLEVFGARSSDGSILHTFQLTPQPGSLWSPWLNLGAKMKPGIALGRNPDSRIEIFTVRPSDNRIFHTFQLRGTHSTNWAGWTDMSLMGDSLEARHSAGPNWTRLMDIGSTTPSYPVVATNAQGNLEIFAFDPGVERILNHRTQISGNLLWADWSSMDRSASQYTSRTWRIEDGLPDNRIEAVAQTPDGYIWVGTRDGLASFDGTRFTPCAATERLRASHGSINCLLVDKEGKLWIGSDGGGLSCLSKGILSRYGAADGLPGDRVTALCEGIDGSLWIGTTTGLSHRQEGRFVNYTVKEGLLSDSVRSVLEDSETNLWVTTDKGLNLVSSRAISKFTRQNGLPDDSLSGLWQDVPGRLWIGSARGMILRRARSFYAYDQRFGLSDRFVNVIRNDRQGDIWLGTDKGLSRFQGGYFTDEMNDEGAPFGKINSLFEDLEGNLWVGSENGLSRLAPKGLRVYGTQQGLTEENVTAVVEDDNGSLWLGNRAGLDQLNGDALTAYTPAKGFPIELVSCLCKGRDGSLWVGGDDGAGVAQIKDGNPIRYTREDGLADGKVTVICQDPSSNVWIGTSMGLSCLAGHRFITNEVVSRIAGRSVRALRQDTRGALWIGTQTGLCRWNEGQFDSFTTDNGLSDNVINALFQDADGSLWIGTAQGGLNRYRNGRFTPYTVKNGLFSDEIFDIVEDDFNWLWMSCSRGVFRVLKFDFDSLDAHRYRTISSIAYGRNDGMASVLCSVGKPGAWKTRDGVLWFATSEGVVAIDPKAIHINKSLPSVYVEQLVLDGKPWPSSLSPNAPIQIPPGHRELEVHYTALGIPTPERIRFKYKLDRSDSDWVDANTRRVAYYENLSPGSYSFAVAACNNDGVWSPATGSLAIVLLPHIWETWWFRLLAVTGCAGFVAVVARQATKSRMQRKMELLQRQHAVEKERMRIARDIHDDLGGSLTQITFLGEMAKRDLAKPAEAAAHVDRLTQSARHTARALDEIVWAVRPENDRLDHLALYLWQFAEEFFGATPVRCRVESPADLPACFVSADSRHGIYLVVKEAFNNTLKHAGATEVRLRLDFRDGTLSVAIEDNGHGFNPRAGAVLGNGLGNMKKRVEELGGQFSVASEGGNGAQLKFSIPLKNGKPH